LNEIELRFSILASIVSIVVGKIAHYLRGQIRQSFRSRKRAHMFQTRSGGVAGVTDIRSLVKEKGSDE
jgi:hypothetical protein